MVIRQTIVSKLQLFVLFMQLEKNENPGEQKSSQVGSKTSRKKSNVNYIEAVPSLPTYCPDEGEIGRVLKLLFVPEEPTPVKVVLEYPFGRVELLDYDKLVKLFIFSTLFGHPDTVLHFCIQDFLPVCDLDTLDTDFAARGLAEWGITKVSLWTEDGSTKIVDTKTFYEAFKQQLENKSDELVIQYENEEIRIPNKLYYRLLDDSEE